ncbi:hypothetical protein IL306_005029 [Fusarium sp. DS 682]|nr:hypothetical protein IL306_005029 [Fusarium sp. DS 682]
MDESFIAQSSKRVIPIQQWIQRWSTCIVPEKSPNEIFQDEHQQAKTDLDAAYEKYKSQGTPDSFSEFERCMQRLKAFAQPYEATKEAKERDYQHSEWNRQVLFAGGLLDIFGNATAVNAIFNDWCERAGTQHSSHSNATENQNQTTALRYFPVNNSPETQDSLRSESQNPTIEPIPTPPRTHSPGEPSTHDQPAEVEPNGLRTRSKKHKNTSAPPASHPVKRSRQVLSEAAPTEKIEFDEVYQDGQAEDKYTIVEHDRCYYILRCKKHGLVFSGEHPLQGAMNHLRGPGHPIESVNYSLAITRLGVLVLNCDGDRKEKNNTVVKRHVKQMEDQRRRRYRASQAHRDLKRDPRHGEMYMAWWDLGKQKAKTASQKSSQKASEEEDLKLFAFLVLPFFPQESNSFGLSVTTSNLKKDIPACYKYNRSSGMYGWAEDYMPDSEMESNHDDGDQDESSSDDTSSDSDSDSDSDSGGRSSDNNDDNDLPIAFRYTHTRNGRKYEIIHLDDDGTPRTVMEDPENYPLRWSTPEPEVKEEPGSQDGLQQQPDSPRNPGPNFNQAHQGYIARVPTVASQPSASTPIQHVEIRNTGPMWTLPERSGGWPTQTSRQSTDPIERSRDG